MASINVIPKIRCDNCGLTVEQQRRSATIADYTKQSMWGSCKMEGGRSTDSYGGKARLDFVDLCERCANAALDAAATALEKTRSEGFDGPTGAE